MEKKKERAHGEKKKRAHGEKKESANTTTSAAFHSISNHKARLCEVCVCKKAPCGSTKRGERKVFFYTIAIWKKRNQIDNPKTQSGKKRNQIDNPKKRNGDKCARILTT